MQIGIHTNGNPVMLVNIHANKPFGDWRLWHTPMAVLRLLCNRYRQTANRQMATYTLNLAGWRRCYPMGRALTSTVWSASHSRCSPGRCACSNKREGIFSTLSHSAAGSGLPENLSATDTGMIGAVGTAIQRWNFRTVSYFSALDESALRSEYAAGQVILLKGEPNGGPPGHCNRRGQPRPAQTCMSNL